jgi:hypothetical protein
LPDVTDSETQQQIVDALGAVSGYWISPASTTMIQEVTSDNWAMRMNMKSMRYWSGLDADINNPLAGIQRTYTYGVQWTAQIDTKFISTPNAIYQLWWSPKWILNDANSYANYMCQVTIPSNGTPAASNLKTNFRKTSQPVTSAAQPSGKATGTFNVGTALQTSSTTFAAYAAYFSATDDGWFQYKCSGYRFNNDSNSVMTGFKVNEEVEYDAGYRAWQGANAQTNLGATPAPTSTFKYLVLDSALALAVGSATVYSVASLMY